MPQPKPHKRSEASHEYSLKRGHQSSLTSARESNGSSTADASQFTQVQRGWPTSNSSWEALNANSSFTEGRGHHQTQPHASEMTLLDRWRNETQQQGAWNAIGSVMTQPQDGIGDGRETPANAWSNQAENGSSNE